MCPRSSDPLYVGTYNIKWVTTSWTHSINKGKTVLKNLSHAIINGEERRGRDGAIIDRKHKTLYIVMMVFSTNFSLTLLIYLSFVHYKAYIFLHTS